MHRLGALPPVAVPKQLSAGQREARGLPRHIPLAFQRFIGVAEIAGAVGITIPAALHLLTWLTPWPLWGWRWLDSLRQSSISAGAKCLWSQWCSCSGCSPHSLPTPARSRRLFKSARLADPDPVAIGLVELDRGVAVPERAPRG